MITADPDALAQIERLANEAEVHVKLRIVDASPAAPGRAREAWHAIDAQEILLGSALPAMVTSVHPAGWVCVDLVGGPGPVCAMLRYDLGQAPAVHRSLRHAWSSKRTIDVPSEFFTLPAAEQHPLFFELIVEQWLDDELLEGAE